MIEHLAAALRRLARLPLLRRLRRTRAANRLADAVYHGIPTLRGKRVPLTFRHLALNHQPKVDPEETITLSIGYISKYPPWLLWQIWTPFSEISGWNAVAI